MLRRKNIMKGIVNKKRLKIIIIKKISRQSIIIVKIMIILSLIMT